MLHFALCRVPRVALRRGICPPLKELKSAGLERNRSSTAEARLARLRASLPIGHACRTLFEEEEP